MSANILKALKTCVLDNKDEKLYIANSREIARLIIQLYMSDFYPSIHSDKDLTTKHLLSLKMPEDKQRLQKEK